MNIANRLSECARQHPDKTAVICCKTQRSLNFLELEILSNRYANGFRQRGFKQGMKTLLFIRPGLDFPAVVFALFKLGVVPVLIDPGMGRKNLLNAISKVKPDAMIAVPEVHIARFFFRRYFRSIKIFVTSGKCSWGKAHKLSAIRKDHASGVTFQAYDAPENELAAILFTSGGTGIPKGVEYSHKIFSTQTDLLQKLFFLTLDDTDLPGFPLFALFTIALGMTSCIPDMDPSRPSSADPAKLVKHITDYHVTFAAGSPAIWSKVAKYCIKNKVTLPSVKYLVMFGAPVAIDLHEKFSAVLTNGTTYTPYGATESLPVANISGDYILKNTAEQTVDGKGTCIGNVVPETKLKIINATDDVIKSIRDTEELPANQVGEIIVAGDVVTKTYFDMKQETAKAKIYDGDTIWHRIGDMGYLDENNHLWFCGRKTHKVETTEGPRYSVQCEAIFNQHPKVKRSALIGIGKPGSQIPAIVIEKKKGSFIKKDDLLALAAKHEHTKQIKHFFFHPSFPVDVRHNIKIDRLKLRDQFSNQVNS